MLSPIPEALADLRAGRMIILVDDESRENEGDLVQAASFVTPDSINFMLRVARGYLCLCLTEADCERLELHPQAMKNTSFRGTPFTVSIDGHPRHGFTTGVSAAERAATIRLAIDPNSRPDDFVRPGHINPLRSRDGGVLVRTGQTEGSVDLCRLAGLSPAAVLLEIMRDDGEMARMPDLERLAQTHGLRICSVKQIIEHRLSRDALVRRMPPAAGTPIETEAGAFTLIAFESAVDPLPHIALVTGGVGALDGHGRPIESDEPTLVRMHRRNLLGDLFGDVRSSPEGPTGATLRASMRMIQKAGRGAVIYLRPEGFGDELHQKLQMIRRTGAVDPHLEAALGAPAASGAPMPLREFGIGGQILRDLGLRKLRLISNHTRELPGLEAFGLEIVDRVGVEI